MSWTIPGTRLTMEREEATQIPNQFASLFLAGGLTLGQISAITGLEGYVIQNWTRRGFLLPPVGRRYSLAQLCRIAAINAVKDVLAIEQICRVLEHSGSDTELYFLFVEAIAHRGREEAQEKTRQMQDSLQILCKAWAAAEAMGQANEIFRKTIQKEKDCV